MVNPRDIIGIVLGVLLGLVGVVALATRMEWCLVGAVLLFISVSLLIPGRHYQHGKVRVMGFAALSLASAASITGAVFAGLGAFAFWSDPQDDWALLGLMIAAAGTLLSALAGAGAVVMVQKVRPRPAHTRGAVAVGIAAGLLNTALLYLLLFHY